eukprot:8853-Pelagomonas_calceolata.AAC.2
MGTKFGALVRQIGKWGSRVCVCVCQATNVRAGVIVGLGQQHRPVDFLERKFASNAGFFALLSCTGAGVWPAAGPAAHAVGPTQGDVGSSTGFLTTLSRAGDDMGPAEDSAAHAAGPP